MCGISGIYNFHSMKSVEIGILKKMNRTLVHRGPDDEGYYVNENLGMGMRRLAIIDLASGGQPIHNEDKSIWVVFNGEIYNYKELRQVLKNRGHKFYTSSDTETIVHLYEEFGEECLNHLRGMFAIALWDSKRKTLFLVRDRLGIKPLFYSVLNGKEIVFASEIKALLKHPSVSTAIDLQALDAYFAYQYIPAPLTIYKDIRKLPAGHLIRVNNAKIVIRKYWDLEFVPNFDKSEEYFIEQFEELFKEAVRMRLISDVPIGGFLSGGVDSSMVISHMALSLNSPVNAFTVGFTGNIGGYLDERPFAKLVAKKYRVNHEMIEIKPDIESILDHLVEALDEPFADDSLIPTYYICDSAKRKVKVVLTGLGGDELFGGYERYLGFRMSMLYDYLPRFISEHLVKPVIYFLPEARNGSSRVNHMKRFIRAAALPLEERYTNYVTILDVYSRKELFDKEISRQIDFGQTVQLMTDYYSHAENFQDPLDKIFYLDIKTYLPEDILTLTDRVGMYHSLELRVPFTDHKLVEFCATIPSKYKIRFMQKKFLLKKVARKYLPKQVIYHKKQGFCSPMASWLRADLKAFCHQILSRENINKHAILNSQYVRKILREHLSLKERHDRVLFAIIIFQKWCDKIHNLN